MIIALNNKCNLDKEEFIKYTDELETINSNHEIIVCPTTINIPMFNNYKLKLGSQNVAVNNTGAFTGEVCAKQLKSYGVKYSIVGHSERRQYQKETNKEVNEKLKRLLENEIIPILCIGETLEERKSNKQEEVLLKEIKEGLIDLTEEEKEKIIIAYEPIWSIGTGLIPSNEEIIEVVNLIKKELPNNKVLYGGSANEENISTLKEIKKIDGYLLGGLSLKIDKLKVFLEKLN